MSVDRDQMDFSLAAVLGYLGALSNMVWPLLRTRRSMLAAQVVGALLFAAHYTFLGAFTAAFLMAVAGIQAVAAIPLGTDPRFRVVYLGTLPLIAGIMASSWHGVASLFASLGMATVSVARYQLDLIRFRALLVACVPFWMVHNLLVGSVPGLMSDAVSFSAGAWMLWREIKARRNLSPGDDMSTL